MMQVRLSVEPRSLAASITSRAASCSTFAMPRGSWAECSRSQTISTAIWSSSTSHTPSLAPISIHFAHRKHRLDLSRHTSQNHEDRLRPRLHVALLPSPLPLFRLQGQCEQPRRLRNPLKSPRFTSFLGATLRFRAHERPPLDAREAPRGREALDTRGARAFAARVHPDHLTPELLDALLLGG